MTLYEFIQKIRIKVGDIEDPFLLQDDLYVNYINNIVSQVYKIPIKVNTYSLNIIPNQIEYQLPEYILNIYSAYSTNSIPIISLKELITTAGGYSLDYLNKIQTTTLVKDYKPDNIIAILPIPTTNYTIQLLCHMKPPMYSLNDLMNQIEIIPDTLLENCIIAGVCMLFYSVDDSETFNLERFQIYKAEYESLYNKLKANHLYYTQPSRINMSFAGFL